MKVKLRSLKPEDAPLMLEWMHDPSVVEKLQTNFAGKTLDDCLAFIAAAQESSKDLHLAITQEENDTYLGTVSLKHIRDGQAEFAITVRKCTMGTGYAIEAMRAILAYGIGELKLKRIYWCVDPENRRAVRFYEKNGFRRISAPETGDYTPEQRLAYLWYEWTEEDTVPA